ncbi:TetR family transcriptional regulator [Mangrovibacter sp. SLW1]
MTEATMNEPVIDKKQAILKDVLRVFARQGYRKTSMDELARAAGLANRVCIFTSVVRVNYL